MEAAVDWGVPHIAVLSPVVRDGRATDLRIEVLSGESWAAVARERLAPELLTDGAPPRPEALVGRLVSEVLPAAVEDGELRALCSVADTGKPVFVTRPAHPGGAAPARRLLVQRGTGGCVVVGVRPFDETERRREDEDQAAPRWRQAVAEAPVGIAVASAEGRILDVNPALCRLFGRLREDLVGTTFTELSHPEDRERRLDRAALQRDGRVEVRKRFVTGDGRTAWLRLVVTAVVEEGEPRFLTVVEDVTEAVRGQAELTRLAFTDALTGLPNRADLRRRLRRALRRWSEGRAPAPVLLLLGIDRFRVVNDSLGHDAGDRLLRAVAGVLQDAVGDAGDVARLGGDEFAVLVHDPLATPHLCEEVRRAVAGTRQASGREVALSVSIGKARACAASDDGGLLRDADTALHAAKRAGGDRCTVFDDELRDRAVARLEVEAQLRRALEAGEVVAHHQPITTPDGRWRGTEALVRWQHPERGLLAPFHFLDVAEETGLVVPLGQQVLRAACADAARWRRVRPGFVVSVNVAARHLASGHLVDDVVAALDAAGLPGEALTLEVTETGLLVHDEVVAAALTALRDLGCHVALDDFGTGYSSLAHLRDFPVDVLKVDRSFVAAAPSSADADRLLRGICSLGRGLGLTVVAEGVEDAAVRAAALAAGADLLQGYLLGRPVPAEAVDAALEDPALSDPRLSDPRFDDPRSDDPVAVG